ncbi:hypothetical protein CONLIGDRAFT_645318 [Coniochaeta ligniaria NRRL 30616]|uniref:NACHT domain-containing protein n=1 Tax=Coniochaeta ligniaria NRRL 30616 TaxID=1408157 RepID=A0A1J7IP93_9PEZI|nr:hypothetical protein CONLIGDRAFT_645318 [Coniochaeta ligniaria NRRL 30616]
MAEVLAFGASVVAFIQLADRVVSLAKGYLDALRDAPAAIRAIFVQVSALRAVLESLAFLTRSQGQLPLDIVQHLGAPGGVIDLCRGAVADLADLIPEDVDSDSITTKKKKRVQATELMTRLAWPFKEERARKKLDEIDRYSRSITLALSTQTISICYTELDRLTVFHSQEMQNVKQTVEKISRSLSANDRRAICTWVQSTDPSSLHERTMSLHEDHTGAWVLQTPEWEAWLAGHARCLWIHGIPGSGKSVLASFLIRQLENYCVLQYRHAPVYYYCYFGNNQDESTHLLKWVISQLCRRSENVPPQLVHLHDQDRSPGKSQLLSILEVVLRSFDKVFLSIDALDESKPQQPLLDLIKTLVTDARFRNLQLFATSREHLDIEEVMTAISLLVPMDHKLVQKDIRTYVRSVLNTSRDFKRWSPTLRDHVEQVLAIGAKGMFRWAFCQLDILRRLTTVHQIYAALDNLPQTLDQTYERILSNIPPNHMHIVRKVLVVLCGHASVGSKYQFKNLELDQLLAIVLGTEEDCMHHPDDPLYDTEMLRDICGCLIKVGFWEPDWDPPDESPRPRGTYVFLAHYTVVEFLLSSRSSSSAISEVVFFGISSTELAREYGTVILEATAAYYKHPEALPGTTHFDTLTQLVLDFLHPLEAKRSTEWTVREISDLTPLIWEFANDGDFNCGINSECGPFTWWLWGSPRGETLYAFLMLVIHGFPRLAAMHVNARRSSLLDLGADQNAVMLLNDFNMTRPYHVVQSDKNKFADLTSTISHTLGPMKLLILLLGSHRHSKKGCNGIGGMGCDQCSIRTVLLLGADPNCLQYSKTPLQLAVERSDILATELLLRFNADPNRVPTEDRVQLGGYAFTEDRRQWSPLRLCREAPCVLNTINSAFGPHPRDLCSRIHKRACEQRGPGSLRQEIEQLLIKHGARDFEMSADGTEIPLVEPPG